MRLEVDRLRLRTVASACAPFGRASARRPLLSPQLLSMSYPWETKIHPFNRIVEIELEEFYELCGLYLI